MELNIVDGIVVDPKSRITTETRGIGNAGNLTISTGTLTIREGGVVSTTTFAANNGGKGGNLTITASDRIELLGISSDGQSRSGLGSQTNGSGDAGNLTINTRSLIVQGGASISTNTFAAVGGGRGGDIAITASELVEVL